MLITNIKLVHYKPLQFSDHHELEMNLTAPVQIIVGDNGSGKSSVCRALTPLPPDSTEYSKGGYKSITISHNGHTYILSSDFSHGIRHSFLKDDVELNVSGTQKTQQELVTAELEFTPTVDTLCSNGLNICNIRVGERRNRLLELYPGNISFVNQHHKNVCSELRVCAGNIRMLRDTQAELEAQLLPAAELTGLRTALQSLLELSSRVDNELFATEREVERLTKDPHYLQSIELDPSSVQQRAEAIYTELREKRKQYPQLFLADDLQMLTGVHTANSEHLRSEVQRLNAASQELATQIAECEHVLDASAKQEIEELNTRIEALQVRLNGLNIDPAVPKLNAEELQIFQTQTADRISTLVQYFAGIRVWSLHSLNKAKQKSEQWTHEQSSLLQQIQTASQQVGLARDRLQRLLTVVPKQGCRENCGLLNGFESTRKADEFYLRQAEQRLRSLEAQRDRLKARMERLQNHAARLWSGERFLRELEEIFTWNSWGKYVLNGSQLIKLLNHNPTQIANRVQHIIRHSTLQLQYDEAQAELTSLTFKRKTLESVNRPASDLISKTLLEQQLKLDQTLKALQRAQQQLTDNTAELQVLQVINRGLKELQQHNSDLVAYIEQQIVQTKIRIRRMQIEHFQQAKRQLLLKIGTLEQTIRTQEHLNSRLHDGTLPQLTKLLDRQRKLAHLEMALSPTTGLPHCYLVRFLNTIIRNVNTIINSIWSYDLNLLPIDEDKPLTFEFPVAINRTGHIRDIGICSDGQKEIINLAWTIVLADLNGVLANYPLKLDEPDKGISHGNRGRVLELLARLIQQHSIKQMILINHHESLYSSFAHSEVLCLSAENITVPSVFNQHVVMK